MTSQYRQYRCRQARLHSRLNGRTSSSAGLSGAFTLIELLVVITILLVLASPLLMAFWFAPLLAAWDDVPAGKALFFSFVACMRNWRAFLTYGIGLLIIALGAGLLIAILELVSPLLALLPADIIVQVYARDRAPR